MYDATRQKQIIETNKKKTSTFVELRARVLGELNFQKDLRFC